MHGDKYVFREAEARPIETLRPGGGLALEFYEGVWSGGRSDWAGQVGRWSRLIDDGTAQILLDTSSIFTSGWAFRQDGRLLLRLRYQGGIVNREEMFIIDPQARDWRDLADARQPRPLAELSDAVLAAWSSARTNQFDRGTEWYAKGIKTIERLYSPLGTVRCEQIDWEIVHSWGLIPRIYVTETNEKVLDLGEWGDTALFAFEGDDVLRITLGNLEKTMILVHPHERMCRLADGGDKLTFEELNRLFDVGEFPARVAEAQQRAVLGRND